MHETATNVYHLLLGLCGIVPKKPHKSAMHHSAKGNCGYVKTAKTDIKMDIPEPDNSGIAYSTGGSLQKSKADSKKAESAEHILP